MPPSSSSFIITAMPSIIFTFHFSLSLRHQRCQFHPYSPTSMPPSPCFLHRLVAAASSFLLAPSSSSAAAAIAPSFSVFPHERPMRVFVRRHPWLPLPSPSSSMVSSIDLRVLPLPPPPSTTKPGRCRFLCHSHDKYLSLTMECSCHGSATEDACACGPFERSSGVTIQLLAEVGEQPD